MEKKSIDRIEVAIEDTTAELKRLTEFLEFTLNSRLDSEIKREFSNRLEKEIEWLEQIRQEDSEALSFFDMAIDREIEEAIEKRHQERGE